MPAEEGLHEGAEHRGGALSLGFTGGEKQLTGAVAALFGWELLCARLHSFRQLLPHDSPVAEFFPVSKKTAVAYGVEQALFPAFFIDPGRLGVQNKDAVFFDIIHHPAFNVGVTFPDQGGANTFRLDRRKPEFFKFI
jgi:hypothetical protein